MEVSTVLLDLTSSPCGCVDSTVRLKSSVCAGISGSGKGQSQLTLSAGVQYYTSVRAVTGAGHVLESTSDGFMVDSTPPQIAVTSVGAEAANTTRVLYQRETDLYRAGWSVDDPSSGVAGVWLRLGTYRGRTAHG